MGVDTSLNIKGTFDWTSSRTGTRGSTPELAFDWIPEPSELVPAVPAQ